MNSFALSLSFFLSPNQNQHEGPDFTDTHTHTHTEKPKIRLPISVILLETRNKGQRKIDASHLKAGAESFMSDSMILLA